MSRNKKEKVILYTKSNCRKCLERKAELKKLGIDFEERNINYNGEYLFEIAEYEHMVPFEVYPWKHIVIKTDDAKKDLKREDFDKLIQFMDKVGYKYFVLDTDEVLARDLRKEYYKKTLRGV